MTNPNNLVTSKSDKIFLNILLTVITISALVYFGRYLFFAVAAQERLVQDFWVFFKVAKNLHTPHPTPYNAMELDTYYPYLYPPFFLFILSPIGYLSYPIALSLWLGGQILFFYATLIYFLRSKGQVIRLPIIIALSLPFIISVLLSGQMGLLTSGLILLGFSLIHIKRFYVAGLILALVTFKPQLGAIIPLILLFSRNWKSLAAFIIALIVISFMSITVYGIQSWVDFFNALELHAKVMAGAPPKLIKQTISIYYALRMNGITSQTAIVIHAFFALTSIFIIAKVFLQKDTNRDIKFFALLFLLSPYIFIYDAPLLVAVLYYFTLNINNGFNRIALMAGGFLPSIINQCQTTHIAIGAPIILLIAIVACRYKSESINNNDIAQPTSL